MIKKQIAFVVTVAVLVFNGCGDDRSHPKNSKLGVKSYVEYKSPTALLDVTAPFRDGVRGYTIADDDDNNTNTILYRWFSKDDTLVFDGARSKDLDREGNATIQKFTWLVKNENNATMSNECINQNTIGSRLIIKICDEADDREEEKFSVLLTVTDNENKTASTKKTITLY